MTHVFEDRKKWNALGTEEKLDALHDGLAKLFAIAEDLNHRNHIFIDAINLVHGRIDEHEKAVHALQLHELSAEILTH